MNDKLTETIERLPGGGHLVYHSVSKAVTEYVAVDELKAAFAELERLRAMVNGQRYLLARLAPNCISCGLPKGSVCPAGYPGCGLADDMSFETPELKELADKWRANIPTNGVESL